MFKKLLNLHINILWERVLNLNRKMNFWKKIIEKLHSQQSVILMIVVKSEGSSPGKAGFKMAVAQDGEIDGSIGGGAMEYRLTEQCRERLKQTNQTIIIQKQNHHPDGGKKGSGMICSGVQWIAFYPLNNHHLLLINEIVEIESSKSTQVVNYTDAGISISNPQIDLHYPVSENNINAWHYSEQPGVKNKLIIFGAGHVSYMLSKLAKDIDFDVEVYDNRKDLNTFRDNTFADRKEIISYTNASDHIPDGMNIFVVIMTFAHKSDTLILKQIFPKKVKYVGMMGSDSKVKSVFETLEKEGFSKLQLSQADSPIGIRIKSITPAEIAVSIMAKIIKVKNS